MLQLKLMVFLTVLGKVLPAGGGKLWAHQYKRDVNILERLQQRAREMNKALVFLSEKRLRGLAVLSPEKRRLRGILSMCICT